MSEPTEKYTVKVPAASKPAPYGILKVSGRNIVGEDGKPVILRGAGLGIIPSITSYRIERFDRSGG